MSNVLPQGWTAAPLGEIADINPRHPKRLDDSMPVSFAPMAAVSESKPEFQFMEERALGKVRQGFTHFAEGDVLFAKITPCMENGKGAVATGLSNGLGCGTTELIVLRPLAEIDPHYVYRFLAQPSIRREAKEHFTGTAGQARVPVGFIEQLEIPLAPLAEQRRIVATLDRLVGKVDACQRRLANIPDLLTRFRQSVLAGASSGRLSADWRQEIAGQNRSSMGNGGTSLPNSWSSRPFSDFIESSFYGPRFSADSYSTKGVPTIRTTDMSFEGAIILRDAPRVSLSKKDLERFRVQDDDLLVTRTGATIGKCALYDASLGPAIPSAYLIRFRLKRDAIVPKFALRFLMSPIGQKLLVGGSTAVAQPNVNATTISQFMIPSPPFAEQREIVRRVEALFALADQIEARLAQAQAQVDKLTPSLFAKAFNGELVPTEAELALQDGRDYEPASVLLERIQRERNGGRSDTRKEPLLRKAVSRSAQAVKKSRQGLTQQRAPTSARPRGLVREGLVKKPPQTAR